MRGRRVMLTCRLPGLHDKSARQTPVVTRRRITGCAGKSREVDGYQRLHEPSPGSFRGRGAPSLRLGCAGNSEARTRLAHRSAAC